MGGSDPAPRGLTTLLVEGPGFDGERLEVAGESYRHLFRARRLAVGSLLRVVDGRGRARNAEVVAVDRRRGLVALGKEMPKVEATTELVLAVGALRPERASWLVEKVTELGVAGVLWYHSQRSVRTFGTGTLERLRRVARSALEQSGGARLPELRGMIDFDGLIDAAREERSLLLDPGGSETLTGHGGGPLLLIVGPEGGFAATERSALADAGVLRVGLGERILRVETAAVVASGLVLLGPLHR